MSLHADLDLASALGLGGAAELVAIVGGGGKSSLAFALARHLPGRNVVTTTTRIFAAQMSLADRFCTTATAGWQAELDGFARELLVVGRIEGERAFGVERDVPRRLLAHPRVDRVLVEADGSRMRPVKAPAEHEPVIPDGATHVVAVAGIDALEAPIEASAHRPERVAAITRRAAHERLDPEALARLLTSNAGGRKAVPDDARFAILLNKVETPERRAAAQVTAAAACATGRVDRVAMGALRAGCDRGWMLATPR